MLPKTTDQKIREALPEIEALEARIIVLGRLKVRVQQKINNTPKRAIFLVHIDEEITYLEGLLQQAITTLFIALDSK